MRPLRVLGLTNFYPPAARGGYGEISADIMGGLAGRGHSVRMLVAGETATGPLQKDAGSAGVDVRRELDYVLAPWRRPRAGLHAVAHDQEVVRSAIDEGVDLAVAWHMRGLMKPSLRLLHDAGIPVMYMLHDRWVLYERAGPWLAPWPVIDRLGLAYLREVGGRLSRRLELRAPPIARDGMVCFVSRWLRDEYARLGWRPRHARIVSGGVDLERFRVARHARVAPPLRRLLFAGRMHSTKGLHVAVRALAEAGQDLTLTVAGPQDDPDYVARVRADAYARGVANRISWEGEVPRERVIELLGTHDVLVYPSVAPEAGWLGLLEGLAAQRPVVTSATGAPREHLIDGQNALLFEPGDVAGLAHQLDRLASDAQLVDSLQQGAWATAEKMSLGAAVDEVEGIMDELVGAEA
jgi:glycosyltransferase involved in cell wall biosynthesis